MSHACRPPSGHGVLTWAEQKLREGRLAEASACVSSALAASPNNGHAHYLRGGVLTLGRDSHGAISAFRTAVVVAPRHVDAYFELGNALYSLGEFSAAERSYLSALGVDPSRALCYLNLGNLYSEQRRDKRAERNFRSAIAIAPAASWDGCASANGLSNLLEGALRTEEAQHVASRALAASSACHYAAHNLARLLRQRGRHPEAVILARRAVAQSPSQQEYRIGLGAALHTASRWHEASKVYRDALRHSPSDHRLHFDLANTLQQSGQAAEALSQYARALPLQLAHASSVLPVSTPMRAERGRSARSKDHPSRRPRLLFYCRLRAHASAESSAEDVWGPSTLAEKGLGGSEEAVVFVSREMARRGWDVTVYANPPPTDLTRLDHGVAWREWHSIVQEEEEGSAVDALISWRNLEGATLLPRAASRYVWLQDIVDVPQAYHEAIVAQLSGIFVLSAFHERGLPRHAAKIAIRTSNGINAATLVPTATNSHWRMMYAAWPTAGLQPLLERWPSIRRAILASELASSRGSEFGMPTLAVYYGFPRWLESMHKGDAWYKKWRGHMEELLQQEGVEYYGMVNESAIAHAYSSSGFYVFPSDKPETSGVNLMKAQALGAIPVTSRHPNSSMPEVCAGFDLGPPVPQGAVAIQNDASWFSEWVRALVAAAATPPEQLVQHRASMVATSRRRFDWSSVVETWHLKLGGQSTVPDGAITTQVGGGGGSRDPASSGDNSCNLESGVKFSFGSRQHISGSSLESVQEKRLSRMSPLRQPKQSPPPELAQNPDLPLSPTPPSSLLSVPPPSSVLPQPSPLPPAPMPSSKPVPESPLAQTGDDVSRVAQKSPAARASVAPAQTKHDKGKPEATRRRTAPKRADPVAKADGCSEHGGAQARFETAQRSFAKGDIAAAFACFHSAAKLAPRMAEAWYMTGGMHVVIGQAAEAIPFFDRALQADPSHPHALFELGNAHLGRGASSIATPLFRRSAASFAALAAAGRASEATLLPTVLSNLGNALSELERTAEATHAYEQATLRPPPVCLAFNGLSNCYEGQARFEEARAASMRGVKLVPDCDLGYYNLGRLLRAAERTSEASAAFAAASALKPSESLYANGLGTALHAAGRVAEATSAYRTAVALSPSWSSPYRNLGLIEYEQGGRAREALKWYRQTVLLEPTSAETYCDMGTAYLELSELPSAMAEYKRALLLAPSNDLAHANHVYLSTKLCSWADFEEAHARLRTLSQQLLLQTEARRLQPLQPAAFLFLPPYHALSYERFHPQTLLSLAAAYAERAAERTGAATQPPPLAAWAPSWSDAPVTASQQQSTRRKGQRHRSDMRLRVGYLSTDLGEHPTSHLMRSVWRIQRMRSRVKATCFARSDDGTEQRAYIANTCEEFVDLTKLSWEAAASEIRKRRVMILIDLNGHCGRPQFEILSLRPAPIQITYMGHPGTSGAGFVQYALVDPVTSPPRARSQFSEHLLSLHQWHVTDYRFSHAFDAEGSERDRTLGKPPDGASPIGPRRAWPRGASRRKLGLPDWPDSGSSNSGFVLATFSQLYKISPAVYATWLNALRASPAHTRLWLLHFPLLGATNLAREAAAAGLRTGRLLSAPTAERTFHLARASLADLFLDTSPYGGHTTAGDALWMGTPMISLPNEMMQSRVAASYSTNAGCPQLAVNSLRAFETTAVAVTRRPEIAALLRGCLARSRWTHPSFDTEAWVDAFDEGGRLIWEIHRNGLLPMHVLLPARHTMGAT